MSIRSEANLKLKECGSIEALGPHRAAVLLTELSSILASVSAECVKRKIAYAGKRAELLGQETKASHASILAEASSEYAEFLEAEELRKTIIEAQRSIKYYLRVSEDEQRNQNY